MAIGDFADKAKSMLNDPKVQNAVNSDKAEEISDKILDGAAGFAKKVTGGKFDEQIDGARDKADDAIGNDTPTPHQ